MSDSPITHATTFIPSTLRAGEEYATVEQILMCTDLPHATLHVPHWRIGGVELAVRVRALSLIERDRVQREEDAVAQYCLTWQLACVAPTFTPEQANALANKNPHAVEQVARFIWLLSALDQDWIDHVVTTQTDAPAADAGANASAGADRRAAARAQRVGRTTGDKVQPAAI
jgi:hypothetical protein